MAHQRQQRVRIRDREFEMFGRNPIGDCDRFGEIARVQQRAAALQRLRDRVAPRQTRQQPNHRGIHRIEVRGIGAQQNRLRRGVVLRLREQIEREPVHRRRAIGDDQNLAGSRDHVDSNGTKHETLRGRDICPAGPNDFVHARYRGGAERERRDRLRAADREHAIDAGDVQRRQHQRITDRVGRRHRHDDLADAGDARRHHGHQHRRWIRRLSTGHINTDSIERRHAVPDSIAERVGDFETAMLLCFVERANALCGLPPMHRVRARATRRRTPRVPPVRFRVRPRAHTSADRIVACIRVVPRRRVRAPPR